MNKTKYEMSKEQDFWNWFKANNSKYYYLNQIQDVEVKERLLDNFLETLHRYCDKLFFEIGGIANEPQELIISAGGNTDYFQKAEELVSKAPKISEWQIMALKPPQGVNFITEYKDIRLDPIRMWFFPLDNESDPRVLGLKVYTPNYNSKKEAIFLEGCYEVIDVILGEKSAALDIHHLEVGKLPHNPKEKGLIELSSLPEYISWRKATINY